MECYGQFPRWLVALKACLAIAAQTGKTLMKNVKITRNTQNRIAPQNIWKQSYQDNEKAKQRETRLG
ncbi:MAG: hypothetical protein CL688_06605 [Candidatus Puniceispirillum sp.]|nr:hypothetical protein [Candidatus Puniceispirillum sp.]